MRPKPRVRWALLSAWLLCLAAPALARADAGESSVQPLLELLEERDAAIRDLQRRVAELEAEERPAVRAVPRSEPRTREVSRTVSRSTSSLAVDPSEIEAARALEHSLTRSGALLLPAGLAEMQVGVDYARSHQDLPTLIEEGGRVGASLVRVRGNYFGGSLSTRIGLPLDAQLELNLPYRTRRESLLSPSGSSQLGEARDRESGVGDLTVGIAKTLVRQEGWKPDVIGRVAWNTGTGAANGGAQQLGGSFTVLRRQDPIVFFGRLSYATPLRSGRTRVGDEFGMSLHAQLAVSPYTAFNVGIEQSYLDRSTRRGRSIPGSDGTRSMLRLETATVLSQRLIFSLSIGIGLSENVPDYTIGAAVLSRFGVF